MFDARVLDEITRRVQGALPPGLAPLHEDLRRNLRAALDAAISRMDLVSREEFDIQSAVLARTREKLEALERRVAALETGPAGAREPRAD